MEAFVYWLHLPEHTNFLNEGYIGVSIRPERRLYEHRTCNENPHLTNAFKRYNSNVIQSILLIGTQEYCYEIENKLRPTDHIGWNINEGGTKPPCDPETRLKMSKAKTGKPRSEETKNKIRETLKDTTRPQEVVEKVANSNRGKKRSDEARQHMSDARKDNPKCRGFVRTEEDKKRIRETNIKTWGDKLQYYNRWRGCWMEKNK